MEGRSDGDSTLATLTKVRVDCNVEECEIQEGSEPTAPILRRPMGLLKVAVRKF